MEFLDPFESTIARNSFLVLSISGLIYTRLHWTSADLGKPTDNAVVESFNSELLEYIKAVRITESVFDVVHLENRTSSGACRETMATYASAGATWRGATFSPSQCV